MHTDPIYALTSLSTATHSVAKTRACIASWRAAGLHVRAFNHPDEIPALAALYDVIFVPVVRTSAPIFGKHYIPISAMLQWAAAENVPVLLINADIELHLAPWELVRLRWLADEGLCYFVRFNHQGSFASAQRETAGIDGFLFHGRYCTYFSESFLCMGQPFWDYWLPYTFAASGRPIFSVEFPAAFHHNHPLNWSWENWHQCALEFARVSGESPGNGSYEECIAMAVRVRQAFDHFKIALPQAPPHIESWVQRAFGGPEPKLILELGAHQGTDTVWLARLPGVYIHAFEPDPRNHLPALPMPNVTLHRAAIADCDGRGPFILSAEGWGQEWTHSSSIRKPKHHLQYYPVTFGTIIEVEFMTLDSFYRRYKLGTIDFIWADIQGAEGDMARGGQHALRNTRYLYTEYSNDEMYEGQVTLGELLTLLPDFHVVELWEDDVLLKNR